MNAGDFSNKEILAREKEGEREAVVNVFLVLTAGKAFSLTLLRLTLQ